MTLGEAKDRLRKFTDLDLDNYEGEEPSDEALTSQINWAVRLFARKTFCRYSHKIALVLQEGVDTYDLHDLSKVSKLVLQPRRVTVKESVLRAPDGYPGLWSLHELEVTSPGYQSYEPGFPRVAVWHSDQFLLLSPPPSSSLVGTLQNPTAYVSGFYLPSALTSDNQQLDIPIGYHEMVCFLAAYFVSVPHATEENGWRRMMEYNQIWREEVDTLLRRSLRQAHGPIDPAMFDSAVIRI